MSNLENNLDNRVEETNKPLPKLTIWKHTADIPVIQWWMGVGVSIAELVWNVALNWWIWTLSATGLRSTPAYRKQLVNNIKLAKEKATTPKNPNWKLSQEEIDQYLLDTKIECIKNEVKKAKEISQGKWAIFINIMVATSNYNKQVIAACEAGVDGIVSWAWLPKNLPEITKDYPDIAIIPILSNVKWVNILLKLRERSWRLPDAIILEDPSTAWWHLGAANLDRVNDEVGKLETSIPEVLALLNSKWINIPIIWAGWIKDKEDIEKIINLWASWAQLWTRFLASKESWANEEFKQAIIKSKLEDILTYISSACLPARALKDSPVFEKIKDIEIKTRVCIENCLNHCGYRDGIINTAQMCIRKELVKSIESWRWSWLWFTGTVAADIHEILSVKEIMDSFK